MSNSTEITDLVLSALPKTWIIDFDGTIVIHNGHLYDGTDSILQGSLEFIRKIPATDVIIILTARTEDYRTQTVRFLEKYGIRYDYILFGMPTGERVLINDKKPSGLITAFAINVVRNEGINVRVSIDPKK